jgi:hypothetical protein
VKARRVKGLDTGASLEENAARIVAVRLDEMRSFIPRALDADNVRAQHDMRIAAKRLRYILEATGFCFGKPAQVAARRARNLQSLLGDMHDCDVMLPMIDAHVADLHADDAGTLRARAGDASKLDPRLAARARHRTAYRGLGVLTVYVQARRKLLFDRFLRFWAEQEEAGTWERLELAVTRRLDEARERRRAAERVENARRQLEAAQRKERAAAERARVAADELAAARGADGAAGIPEGDGWTQVRAAAAGISAATGLRSK